MPEKEADFDRIEQPEVEIREYVRDMALDLKLVLGFIVAMLAFIYLPYLNDTPIRSALGLVMVLFVPGYALIAALFPARKDLGRVERAALSLESGQDREVLQSGARRLAMTIARALQLALLCEHAQWLIDHGGDRRGYAAALRFARLPVDLMHEVDPELDRLLLS